MHSISDLLANNRAWAARQIEREPAFFERLCAIQAPEYLWIGCADSRVPANEIVGLAPGELFVHRNVANIVSPDDTNCVAVLQYAIEVLKIEDVIVCGHYGCGGVEAALDRTLHGPLERWLQHVRDVRSAHGMERDLRLRPPGRDRQRHYRFRSSWPVKPPPFRCRCSGSLLSVPSDASFRRCP